MTLVPAFPAWKNGGKVMNKVTIDQIKAFLVMRKEIEMELMMRQARYHGTSNVAEENGQRIKELERQLLFGNGLMALLTDGERLLVKEHVLEEHTWPIIQSIFKEQWKVEPDAIPTQRAFQMRLNRAFKKLMEVCTRRLDFDFLSECGDLKVELNDK